MSCFDFPGGIGTASRRRRAVAPSACCCCATSAAASTSTCSARGWLRPIARPRPTVPASRSARPTPRPRRTSSAALRCGRCSGWPRRLLRLGGLGRDRARLHGRRRAVAWDRRRRARRALRRRLRVSARGRAQLPRRGPPGPPARRQRAGRVPDRPRARTGRRAGLAVSADEPGRVGLRDEVVALARELIRIDTSNPPGGETAAARHLAAYLERGGPRVRALRAGSRAPEPDCPPARRRRGAVAAADGAHRRGPGAR